MKESQRKPRGQGLVASKGPDPKKKEQARYGKETKGRLWGGNEGGRGDDLGGTRQIDGKR